MIRHASDFVCRECMGIELAETCYFFTVYCDTNAVSWRCRPLGVEVFDNQYPPKECPFLIEHVLNADLDST